MGKEQNLAQLNQQLYTLRRTLICVAYTHLLCRRVNSLAIMSLSSRNPKNLQTSAVARRCHSPTISRRSGWIRCVSHAPRLDSLLLLSCCQRQCFARFHMKTMRWTDDVIWQEEMDELSTVSITFWHWRRIGRVEMKLKTITKTVETRETQELCNLLSERIRFLSHLYNKRENANNGRAKRKKKHHKKIFQV